MSLGSVFLTDIAILTIAALAFSFIFARFHLPVVGGEILAGVIVGPYVLNLVSDPNVINEVSQLGIVLLLFILGLELDPKEVRSIIARVGAMTAIEVGVSTLLIFEGTYYFTNDIPTSIIVAVGLSFASTAVVGRILVDYFRNDEDYNKVLVSLLVIEDVAAILFLIFIPEVSGRTTVRSEGFSLFITSLGGIALLTLSYIFGRYAAPRIINYFAHFELESGEIPFLFSLGLGIIFGALANYLGYSPAIGSFMIGLALRGKYSKFVLQRVNAIRDLFLILFFVSMGTLIDPFSAASIPLVFIGIVLVAIFSKMAGAFVAGSIFATGLSAPSFALWLLPRGEFSLIIAQSAMNSGLISIAVFSIVGIVALITSLVGPICLVRRSKIREKSEFPIRPKSD